MLATMQRSGADFTNTFRSLSRIEPPTTDEGCVVRPQTFDPVLEYILAQSASLEAMRKKSVAAFHPQHAVLYTSNLPALLEHDPKRVAWNLGPEARRSCRKHHALPQPPELVRRLGRVAVAPRADPQ